MEYKIKDIQTYGNNDSIYNSSRKSENQTLFLLENGELYCSGNDYFSHSPFINNCYSNTTCYYPTFVTDNVDSIQCVNCQYGFHAIIKKNNGKYYWTGGGHEYIFTDDYGLKEILPDKKIIKVVSSPTSLIALCDDGKVYGADISKDFLSDKQKEQYKNREEYMNNLLELENITSLGFVEDIYGSSSVKRDINGKGFLVPKINGKYYIFREPEKDMGPTILESDIINIIDFAAAYARFQIIVEKSSGIYIGSYGYETGLVMHNVGNKDSIKYIGFPLPRQDSSLSNVFICLYTNGELNLFIIDTDKTTSTGELKREILETECIEVSSTISEINAVLTNGLVNTYGFKKNEIYKKRDGELVIPNLTSVKKIYNFAHNFQTGILFYEDNFGKVRSSSLYNEGAKGTGSIYNNIESLLMVDEEIKFFINFKKDIVSEHMISNNMYSREADIYFDKKNGTLFTSCRMSPYTSGISSNHPAICNFASQLFGITKSNIIEEKVKTIPDIIMYYSGNNMLYNFYYINTKNELKFINDRKISDSIFFLPEDEKIILQIHLDKENMFPFLAIITNKRILVFNGKEKIQEIIDKNIEYASYSSYHHTILITEKNKIFIFKIKYNENNEIKIEKGFEAILDQNIVGCKKKSFYYYFIYTENKDIVRISNSYKIDIIKIENEEIKNDFKNINIKEVMARYRIFIYRNAHWNISLYN